MSLTLPALPPGPWRAQRYVGGADNWFVLSAEDRGVVGRGGPQVTEVVAKATAAVPRMLEALASWNCGSCGGSGRYKDKGFRGEGAKRHWAEEEVACKVCGGHGIDPRAQDALRLAGATDEVPAVTFPTVEGVGNVTHVAIAGETLELDPTRTDEASPHLTLGDE